MKRRIDYIILFVLNAAGMVLELAASRLMSPYFGNSNFVWTAIIGIILLAGSLGNLIGGKIARRENARVVTAGLLLFAAVYLAFAPLLDATVLSSIRAETFNTQFAAVVGSTVFFLIPSTILGIVTPVIMKDRITESNDTGAESGRITAIGAIGSLVGTFAGGFWIIPALGVKMILILIAATILISAPLVLNSCKIKTARTGWGLVVSGIVATIIVIICGTTVSALNSAEAETTEISIDTEYGRIIVADGTYAGEKVRFYKQSGAYSSATYVDEARKFDLVFDYLKKYDEMFKFLDVKNTAMIGGAAYQYPKYFISNFPDKMMDVIEIDPISTEIAKKYFYLDDLVKEFGEERLGLINADGRMFLMDTDKKYEAILNDAFSGEVPVATLATKEAAQIIQSRLKDGGVYMSNVLGALEGSKGRFLRAEVKTLQQVFRYVYVMSVRENVKKNTTANWMVIATDAKSYVPEKVEEIVLTDEDIVLTDDYCPIDALISTEYFD